MIWTAGGTGESEFWGIFGLFGWNIWTCLVLEKAISGPGEASLDRGRNGIFFFFSLACHSNETQAPDKTRQDKTGKKKNRKNGTAGTGKKFGSEYFLRLLFLDSSGWKVEGCLVGRPSVAANFLYFFFFLCLP